MIYLEREEVLGWALLLLGGGIFLFQYLFMWAVVDSPNGLGIVEIRDVAPLIISIFGHGAFLVIPGSISVGGFGMWLITK